MHSPELSIIVPVYKVEKYLPKCIDSILAQSFNNFELILVEDGSPDNCGVICDRYALTDNRIIVIHQPNRGVSAARNAGLDVAKGKYIGFVDSDDWIEPKMYEYLINEMKTHDVDVTICGVNYYSQNGNYLRTGLTGNAIFEKEEALKALYGSPCPIGGGCCNKLFTQKSINNARFNTNIKMAEDIMFLFMCFRNITAAYLGNYAGYNVLERKDSATRGCEIKAYCELIFSGKYELLLLSRNYSLELEAIALDKYMDDCLRYSNLVKEIAKKDHKPYKLLYYRIRFQIIKQLPRAVIKRLLSKELIHRYIYEITQK